MLKLAIRQHSWKCIASFQSTHVSDMISCNKKLLIFSFTMSKYWKLLYFDTGTEELETTDIELPVTHDEDRMEDECVPEVFKFPVHLYDTLLA